MTFNELAKERISCRQYKQQNVSNELILKLLEAAQNAPTAGNIQPCHFYVITDRNVIKDLHGKVFPQTWASNAPVIIIACTNREASASRYGERGRDVYAYIDCAASIQNILLCATDIGLASCCIGDFNIDECKRFIQSDLFTPVAILPIGYANTPLVQALKKPLTETYTIIGDNNITTREAERSIIEMKHCDIAHAEFEDINLYQCSIQKANMTQSIISHVNLQEAKIENSNLTNVSITNCIVDGLVINGEKIK